MRGFTAEAGWPRIRVRSRRGGILKRRRTGVAWATGVFLLVAFVAVAAQHAEGRRFAALLRSAQPAWLGAAAALQAATYVCAAAVLQRALRRNGGVHRSVRSLVLLGLAKLFADQALPSAGVSGTLLVVRGLLRRGVPRGLAIAAMLADLVSWYAAYALAGAAALATLAATLLARGFTFWLPMAPGLAIARHEMMRETASAAPTAGAETP